MGFESIRKVEFGSFSKAHHFQKWYFQAYQFFWIFKLMRTAYLSQPYPCQTHQWNKKLLQATAIGLFVGLFLLVFQPFGLSEIKGRFASLWILGYGLVTFSMMIIEYAIQERLTGQDSESNWTVGKEIVENLCIVLLISLGNYGYTAALGWMDWSWKSLVILIGATLAVAIFPIVAVVWITYVRQLQNNIKEAQTMDRAIASSKPETPTKDDVYIPSQYQQDGLYVRLDELLWISSADNYVEVAFLQKGKVKKTLVRNTLQSLEPLLEKYGILRCHRSFLVNMEQVVHVQGNAQNLRIRFHQLSEEVPVSKKYREKLLQWWQG